MSSPLLAPLANFVAAAVALAVVVWIFSWSDRVGRVAGSVALAGIAVLIAASLLGPRSLALIDGQLR